MHDPDVVLFDIPRPWPRRIGGHTYWPSIVTVWHREPDGHDAGEVCKRCTRVDTPDGKVTVWHHGWKWHVHHWRVTSRPLYSLRRALTGRCAWCGRRHTKRDPLEFVTGWDAPPHPWWRDRPDSYHAKCYTARSESIRADRGSARLVVVVPALAFAAAFLALLALAGTAVLAPLSSWLSPRTGPSYTATTPHGGTR